MAAFSRGCHYVRGLSSSSLKLPQPQRTFQKRSFTGSRGLGLAFKKPVSPGKVRQPPRQKTPPNPVPHVLPTPTKYQQCQDTRQTIISSLAERSSPTLLYEAPSHTAYVLGSYGFGAYMLFYAGYNSYTDYFHLPPDLYVWVPYALHVGYFFMACAGTWVLLGSARLIRTITAIPVHSTPPAISLRIDLRRTIPLPYLKPKVLIVKPSEFILSSRLAGPSTEDLSLANKKARQSEERARDLDRRRIMTAPFREMGRAMRRAWGFLIGIWTREGFLKVHIQGKFGHWQLDREGGWALENGKALDKLVKLK
ncbi:MAG: hypothetical protein M1812_000143 [Candelaria pacifica]|nr:MAG: hypothetical protein M1812_000143 [Candelaria pacifica]